MLPLRSAHGRRFVSAHQEIEIARKDASALAGHHDATHAAERERLFWIHQLFFIASGQDGEGGIALSDAGAHLSFFCDAGFGLHLLGHWVRERRAMPLEEGVRRLTSEPADIFGIADRGRLAVGAHADLLLFDPERVGRSPSRRVCDLPAGAARLTTDAVGVHGVWVNGHRVADARGVDRNGARPGSLLRTFTP